MIDLLQWPGMVLGLLGAVLVASGQARVRRAGFAVWLVSNGCWIVWALHAQAWGLLGMQVFFSVTSVMGWWNNRERGHAV
jgi:hypothetical protein